MNNLEIKFNGLILKNPFIVASSPATETVKGILECAKNNAGAVITKSASVFTRSNKIGCRRVYSENNVYYATSTFERETLTINELKDIVYRVKQLVDIPIFASLAITDFDINKWVNAGLELEKSGADLIHLDLFYLPQPVASHESLLNIKKIIKEMKSILRIPVAPKLNNEIPSYLFCDYFSENDISSVFILDSLRSPPPFDLNRNSKYQFVSNMGMSSVFGGWQKNLTIHYLSVISKTRNFDICVGGGLNSGNDFFEASLLGAKIFMIASEILKKGYKYLSKIIFDFEALMKEKGYNSFKDFQKFNIEYFLDSETPDIKFERAIAKVNLELCVSCGKCSNNAFCESYISPGVINDEICDGCGFCLKLCPTNAISLVQLDNI